MNGVLCAQADKTSGGGDDDDDEGDGGNGMKYKRYLVSLPFMSSSSPTPMRCYSAPLIPNMLVYPTPM